MCTMDYLKPFVSDQKEEFIYIQRGYWYIVINQISVLYNESVRVLLRVWRCEGVWKVSLFVNTDTTLINFFVAF